MIKFLDLKAYTDKYADEIKTAADRVIDSGWFLQGKENERFEQEYAKYIGTEHCVGCANGLDALTLIYRAYIEMGIMKVGDEVIVPANTYIASILAISENGLVPVLIEPDINTLEIDDKKIEAAITPKTRSIMIVHLYGRLAYTAKIAELCKKYNLKLVEDNAQAHGCLYTPSDGNSTAMRTGSLGDAAGHSFYPGKNLGALGDGGAVTTNDKALAEAVRAIANYGSQRKYVFKYRGRNSRLDELQAAILSAKLKHLDADNDHRRLLAAYYYEHISNQLIRLPQRLPDAQNVYHIFPVLCSQRDALQQHLTERGIQTLIHYPIPPHKQECYADWSAQSYPISEQIHAEELSLPISPVMTMEEAKCVVEAINTFKNI
ncbi:MAG: DegT/DnrJ/EryC1/StrS family aminotransferase [Prevotella sp.]|nr:DegT/DnrJ/EryC1/StrS family aminotransferase [Prevotella sp.]MCF0207946.1 DegT/DnrJ/EryC1/StrS family aminotransferase [Bacteroidaceae bacterium]